MNAQSIAQQIVYINDLYRVNMMLKTDINYYASLKEEHIPYHNIEMNLYPFESIESDYLKTTYQQLKNQEKQLRSELVEVKENVHEVE